MRILFISFYSKPENVSSSYYVDDLKKELIKNGHSVFTIAPNPVRNLSKEEIDKYSSTFSELTETGEILRVFVNKDSSNSMLSRVRRMFIFRKKIQKFIKEKHGVFDCVFYYSNPPIFIPIIVGRLCKKYCLKSIYQINDFWPNITGKYHFLKPLAKKAIKSAEHIVTISDDMCKCIKKIQPDSDVTVIRIWPYEVKNGDRINECVLQEYKDDTRFKVSYIGNIGEFQNIDLLFKVALSLKWNKNIVFYFVGGGRLSNKLHKMIFDSKATNIVFIDKVNNATAKSLYENSNLNIISLNKNAVFYCCPSKTSTCILSHSDCLLITDDSLYADMLVKNHGFYHDSSFNPEQIANQILSISNTGLNKRVISSKFEFDKYVNLSKWVLFFEKIKDN